MGLIDQLVLVLGAEPLLLYTIALCFGLIVGSFLNVVIYRLPVMMQRSWEKDASDILGRQAPATTETFNLMFPGSRCPACHHAIGALENIPILSYALLRGRCAHCGAPISLRYPAVELLTGVLTAIVFVKFGPSLTALACCIFTFGLIAASLIDYDHQLIPDDISLPLMWVGLMVNYWSLVVPFQDAFWGAVAGYLVLWIVFQLFLLVTGKEGLGFGDFKLLAMLGAWLGWQSLPLIIILSSLAGAVVGGLLIAFGRDRAKPIPFGPWLAMAGFIALIWGHQITSAYLKFAAF